jgi:hypothetical protein
MACPKCAGDHKSADCSAASEEYKCINCITANKNLGLDLEVNHSVFDRDCRVYNRKLEAHRTRVNFLE